MWSTSAGGHLMKVVNLTGFTVSTIVHTNHSEDGSVYKPKHAARNTTKTSK